MSDTNDSDKTDNGASGAAARDVDTAATERLEGLFGAETDGGATDAAAPADVTAPVHAAGTAAATAPLPEAEPAWLGSWGASTPIRTTPRIRWAGIVWGLVFAATGWFALWTMLAADRRAAFSDWILTLDGGGWAVVAAFALGGLLLVLGLIAGLRSTTRAR